MSFRIDQNWENQGQILLFLYAREPGSSNGNGRLPGPLNGNFHNINFTHYLRFGWDHTISPNLLNSFTIDSTVSTIRVKLSAITDELAGCARNWQR